MNVWLHIYVYIYKLLPCAHMYVSTLLLAFQSNAVSPLENVPASSTCICTQSQHIIQPYLYTWPPQREQLKTNESNAAINQRNSSTWDQGQVDGSLNAHISVSLKRSVFPLVHFRIFLIPEWCKVGGHGWQAWEWVMGLRKNLICKKNVMMEFSLLPCNIGPCKAQRCLDLRIQPLHTGTQRSKC